MFSRKRRHPPIRNSRSQARVWAPLVVVGNPFAKNGAEVALIQRNHGVQAFPPDGSDQSFAERIRLWSSGRSLEGSHSKRSDGRVQLGGERRMSIMNEEA